MFQAGVYQIEVTENGESNLYGYLEIVSSGGQWDLRFHGEKGADWPIPVPTEDKTYAFSVSTAGLPPKTGDGTMRTFDWAPSLGEPEETGPGPLALSIDADSAFVAFVSGDSSLTRGYFGVSDEFSEWPLNLESGQIAVLSLGTAESQNDVVSEANALYGDAWTRRGLIETY